MQKLLTVVMLALLNAQTLTGTASMISDFGRRVATTAMAALAGEAVRHYVPKMPLCSSIDRSPGSDMPERHSKYGLSSNFFVHLPAMGMAFSLNRNRTGAHEQATAALLTGIARVCAKSAIGDFWGNSELVNMLMTNFGAAVLAEGVYHPVANGMNAIIARAKASLKKRSMSYEVLT